MTEPTPTRPASPTSAKGPAPAKRLPTPRIAFQKQLDLLRAYAAASNQGATAADNNKVAEIVDMSAATVSLANPFFADAGLIQRAEGGYLPHRAVVNFARVYQWNPEKAGAELGRVLDKTWFSEVMQRRLQYNPLPEEDALTILGTEAEAGPAYRSQVRALLDYLEVGGLLVREGGQVRLRRPSETPTPAPTSQPDDVPNPEPELPAVSVAVRDAAPGLPLLIQGLLEQLPTTGTWTRADADRWLDLARLTLDVVYKIAPTKGGSRD